MVFNQEDIDLLQKILDATSTNDTSMAFVAVECVGISVKIKK